MGTRERSQAESGDRERREALEALQVELRQARAALAQERSATGAPPEVQALRDAIARAEARRDEAKSARQRLDDEAAALERDERWLAQQVEEVKVLALGASRRDTHVEWATARGRDGQATTVAAQVGVFLFFALLLGLVFLFDYLSRH